MSDNIQDAPLGQQIRDLRQKRGWTLAELARRAGTSAPTLHRYENGWDRFELETLRRIAAALGSRLEIHLTAVVAAPDESPTARTLLRLVAPLFWDRELCESDVAEYPDWVLERVLTSGNAAQVRAARGYFGDEAVRRVAERRGVDPRTRNYWRLILGEEGHAPEGARR